MSLNASWVRPVQYAPGFLYLFSCENIFIHNLKFFKNAPQEKFSLDRPDLGQNSVFELISKLTIK